MNEEYGENHENEDEEMIKREKPEVSQGRSSLVAEWVDKIKDAEAYWGDKFKQMRIDAKYAAGKSKTTEMDVQLTLKHIKSKVASLYAKNPRVRASRKQKIYNKAWDGTEEQLQAARQSVISPQVVAMQAMQTGIPPQPPAMNTVMAQAILQEHAQIEQQKKLLDGVGKSLEYVLQYSLDEQKPKFKPQAKQAVRRAITTSVAYCKIGYQRIMGQSPDTSAQIKDITSKLSRIQYLADNLADGEFCENSKEQEELKIQLEDLQSRKDMILREGLVFTFPAAWSIIVDPCCEQLKGFVGAQWVAQKYLFTREQIQRTYEVDIDSCCAKYTEDGSKKHSRAKSKGYCAVYEVYDLDGQLSFTVVEGYEDFLEEPEEPEVYLEQFHPFFPLTFNDTEEEDDIYCQSDVQLIRPHADEYSRKRNAIRTHRVANTPAYVASASAVDEDMARKFQDHDPMEILFTKLKPDEVDKAIRPKPTIPIDAALYDVEDSFVDIQRVLGKQSADFGAGSQPVISATESSIAANGLATVEKSDIDEIDEWLTDIMEASGQILLLNMDEKTVKDIAGPGALWVQMSREQVAKEVDIKIEAGSSGLPNKQGRLMALEKLSPMLMQLPDVKKERLTRFVVRELDENIDVDEFIEPGAQSVVAGNSGAMPNMAAMPGGAAQAAAGAMNAANPKQSASKVQNMGGMAA